MKKKQKRKFDIGDRVVFKNSIANKIYQIFGYSRSKRGEVKYTLWVDDDYSASIEQWQIKKYHKPTSLGFAPQ